MARIQFWEIVSHILLRLQSVHKYSQIIFILCLLMQREYVKVKNFASNLFQRRFLYYNPDGIYVHVVCVLYTYTQRKSKYFY